MKCPDCKGTGVLNFNAKLICKTCDGTKKVSFCYWLKRKLNKELDKKEEIIVELKS